MSTVYPIYLKLEKENIGMIKYIIETYEDVANVRTLDAESGEIVILALEDTKEHARKILEELSREIEFEEISAPKTLENDWLLKQL